MTSKALLSNVAYCLDGSSSDADAFAKVTHGQMYSTVFCNFFRETTKVTHFDRPNKVATPRNAQNTYKLEPEYKFPRSDILNITRDVVNGQLATRKYDPEFCRRASKRLCDVCLIHLYDNALFFRLLKTK